MSLIVHARRDPMVRNPLVSTPAVRLLAAYWGSLAVVDVTRSAGPATATVACGVLAVLCSVRQRTATAVGVAVTAWLFVTGFAVNEYGDLRLTGADDLVRLLLITAAATSVAALTTTRETR